MSSRMTFLEQKKKKRFRRVIEFASDAKRRGAVEHKETKELVGTSELSTSFGRQLLKGRDKDRGSSSIVIIQHNLEAIPDQGNILDKRPVRSRPSKRETAPDIEDSAGFISITWARLDLRAPQAKIIFRETTIDLCRETRVGVNFLTTLCHAFASSTVGFSSSLGIGYEMTLSSRDRLMLTGIQPGVVRFVIKVSKESDPFRPLVYVHPYLPLIRALNELKMLGIPAIRDCYSKSSRTQLSFTVGWDQSSQTCMERLARRCQ
jgi:hypothetical protein